MTNIKKTIWVVHQYASTPETGMGGRHFYLSRELAKQGHKVYVIAASSNHLLHTQPVITGPYTFEKTEGFTFVWVKMPQYTEAHSKQRAFNWFLFSWKIRALIRLIKDKPDAVLYSSPSPVAFLGAQYLAKYFAAKLVFEVRDIWPLTLTEIGGYSSRHPFVRLMQWIEDKAYHESDCVISNLKNSVEHMVAHGLERRKFNWIANGFSLEEVNSCVPLNCQSRNQLPRNKFLIGYTGSLGVANALYTLIDAAERVKDEKDIVFVLVGGGKEKAALQKEVDAKRLNNVVFIETIPKIEIQSMLSYFDVCYIGWLKNDLYRFGIAANKIPEYLYSGKPILHSYSGACDPVKQFSAGIVSGAQDPKGLSEAILKIYNLTDSERQELGENGHNAALQEYNYKALAEKLFKAIFSD